MPKEMAPLIDKTCREVWSQGKASGGKGANQLLQTTRGKKLAQEWMMEQSKASLRAKQILLYIRHFHLWCSENSPLYRKGEDNLSTVSFLSLVSHKSEPPPKS